MCTVMRYSLPWFINCCWRLGSKMEWHWVMNTARFCVFSNLVFFLCTSWFSPIIWCSKCQTLTHRHYLPNTMYSAILCRKSDICIGSLASLNLLLSLGLVCVLLPTSPYRSTTSAPSIIHPKMFLPITPWNAILRNIVMSYVKPFNY